METLRQDRYLWLVLFVITIFFPVRSFGAPSAGIRIVTRSTVCGIGELKLKIPHPTDPEHLGRVWVCVTPSAGCKSGHYFENTHVTTEDKLVCLP